MLPEKAGLVGEKGDGSGDGIRDDAGEPDRSGVGCVDTRLGLRLIMIFLIGSFSSYSNER